MHSFVAFRSAALASLLVVFPAIQAQSPAAPAPPVFASVAPLPFDTSGPVLRAPAQPLKPFTVSGPRGVLLGQQDGSLEAWVLPVKVLSHLTLEARIDGYSLPIDLNQQAAQIEVRPDRTIITYSHIGFTVRQIMFSAPVPPSAPNEPATGPLVLFEFDCLHPTDFTFRFVPSVQWMWPERSEGMPGVDWISPDPRNPVAPGGFYHLGVDYPDLAAAVTIPGATPGIISPYQERPHDFPAELKLHIDPARDNGRLFPLLMAVGTNRIAAEPRVLGQALARLNAQVPALYSSQADTYKKLLASSTTIETPDKSLDEAFQWAVVSIEQLRTQVQPSATPKELAGQAPETALVAGYLNSADSARPGFGWFFGRDALYTLYAVNGYGDFALTRDELEFLIHRQRPDGKIMHEYSQTAAAVDWQQFSYQWAAADATPLFLLAVADYVRASGDTAFLAAHRSAVEKAWAFETDPAHDTDHDGIYDNSQGTGWVESWPPTMPHQEIYLALLDQQASAAYAFLEKQLNDSTKSAAAAQRAAALVQTINTEYYDQEKSCYGFSRDVLKDGTPTLDRTRTVYPSLAWWSDLPGTTPHAGSVLDHPEGCLRQFVGSAINTDWGTRDVANDEKIYDGMSYHQGSVWPLFTGWAALAEYRANQPLAGYQLLKENANLTRAQDLGSHTELLSGDFFVPMGRSTSHQLWSSAMIITPTLRGLFGLSIDATTKTITVNPHLPASWNHATINNIQLPGGEEDLWFTRTGGELEVAVTDWHKGGWHVKSTLTGAVDGKLQNGFMGIRIPQFPIEIEQAHLNRAIGTDRILMNRMSPPIPGERTSQVKVISEEWTAHKATIVVEGPAGASDTFILFRHQLMRSLHIDSPQNEGITTKEAWKDPVYGAEIDTAKHDPSVPIYIGLNFPPGTGFQTLTVTLTW